MLRREDEERKPSDDLPQSRKESLLNCVFDKRVALYIQKEFFVNIGAKVKILAPRPTRGGNE